MDKPIPFRKGHIMALTLDVPYISQLGIGSHVKGHSGIDDPTGCWYACACMVGYYFEAGPRQGVPELYKRVLSGSQLGHHATGSAPANALEPNHHDLLADREHLEPVDNCATSHAFKLGEIEQLLQDRGPIFFYWQKTDGGSTYGHASVIYGTGFTVVKYHDPENLPRQVMAIGTFNLKRQKWKYALMQREKK